jgi:hypothetical protein
VCCAVCCCAVSAVGAVVLLCCAASPHSVGWAQGLATTAAVDLRSAVVTAVSGEAITTLDGQPVVLYKQQTLKLETR